MRKNKWWFFYLLQKKDKEDICIQLCHYFGRRGLIVIAVIPRRPFMVFTGHFFQRYRQRMGLPFMEPLETAKHFITHNFVDVTRPVEQIDEHTFKIMSGFWEGVAFGLLKDNALLYRTFLTREQLTARQDKLHSVVWEYVQKLKEFTDEKLLKQNPAEYYRLKRLREQEEEAEGNQVKRSWR